MSSGQQTVQSNEVQAKAPNTVQKTLERLRAPDTGLRDFITGLKQGIKGCFADLKSIWAPKGKQDRRIPKIKEWGINLGEEGPNNKQELYQLFDQQTQNQALTRLSQMLISGKEVVLSRNISQLGDNNSTPIASALSEVRLFRAWDNSLRLEVSTSRLVDTQSGATEPLNKLQFKVGGDGPIHAKSLPAILKSVLSQPEGDAWCDSLKLVKALSKTSWAQIVITEDSKLDNLDLRSWPLHRIRIETSGMINKQRGYSGRVRAQQEKVDNLKSSISKLSEELQKVSIKPGVFSKIFNREEPAMQKREPAQIRGELRRAKQDLAKCNRTLRSLKATLGELSENPKADQASIYLLQDRAPWVQFRTPQKGDSSQVAASLTAASIKTTDLHLVRGVERSVREFNQGGTAQVQLRISNNPTALELDKQGETLKLEFKPEGQITLTLNGKKITLKDNPRTRDKCEYLVSLFCKYNGLKVEEVTNDAGVLIKDIKLAQKAGTAEAFDTKFHPPLTIEDLKKQIEAHQENKTRFDETIKELSSAEEGTPKKIVELQELKKRDLQFLRAKLLELSAAAKQEGQDAASSNTTEQSKPQRAVTKPGLPSLSTVLPRSAPTEQAA